MSRRDLSIGAQAVQVAHAVTLLFLQHPEEAHRWTESGRTIIAVQVGDESALAALSARLAEAGAVAIEVREPDFGGELCAVGIPGRYGPKVTSGLPLIGKHFPDYKADRRAGRREAKLRRQARRGEKEGGVG